MTRSAMMTKAHEMARKAIRLGDNYSATFACALRIVWFESRNLTREQKAEALASAINDELNDGTAYGFTASVWTSEAGHCRVYVKSSSRARRECGFAAVMADGSVSQSWKLQRGTLGAIVAKFAA